MDAICTKDLSKSFGKKYAVNHLNLVVPEGAIYGFIGQNGAGKSTTQKLICGLTPLTSGSIELYGKPYTDGVIRSKVGMLIENAGVSVIGVVIGIIMAVVDKEKGCQYESSNI